MNNINVLKKQADTKILIQIVVNVIIVSMVALYIINKNFIIYYNQFKIFFFNKIF